LNKHLSIHFNKR